MPAIRTVYYWESDIDGFFARIQEARAVGFDSIASDMMDIADDKNGDYEAGGEDGEMHFNPEAVARAKLRVETRFKLLSKWDRKRYGDEAGTTNISLNQTTNIVQLTEDQRTKLMEKRRQADERLREMKQAKAREIGDKQE